jgi:poly(3-hydroxybutyrate) depolymerase
MISELTDPTAKKLGATMSIRAFATSLTRLVVCLPLLVLVALASAQPTRENDKDKKAYGKVEKKTYEFKEAGKEMEYALFVPSSYDKEKPAPLVVALHGMGGNPQQMIRSRGLTERAEKLGYIVVAPMGYSRGWYGSRGKGKGFGGKGKSDDGPENLGELSEKDVMNVLALVRKGYAIDEKRIYLIGHSMGGGGTWHLGMKYPDIWAGLAPIAPAAFGRPTGLEKIKHIPVIVVQGDKDTLVRPEGTRRWVEKMKELGLTHEYLEIAGGGHGDVISKGMPKIFDFFEKQYKLKLEKKDDRKG